MPPAATTGRVATIQIFQSLEKSWKASPIRSIRTCGGRANGRGYCANGGVDSGPGKSILLFYPRTTGSPGAGHQTTSTLQQR